MFMLFLRRKDKYILNLARMTIGVSRSMYRKYDKYDNADWNLRIDRVKLSMKIFSN